MYEQLRRPCCRARPGAGFARVRDNTKQPPMTPAGIVADIGGTNARFAIARRDSRGTIALSDHATLQSADFPSFEAAFRHYAQRLESMPHSGVFALASPVATEEIKLTNNPWVLRRSGLAQRLGLAHVTLVNDFEAIARAVSRLDRTSARSLTDVPFALPNDGVVSIVGPGSGLGVGMLIRRGGADQVIACEGGHTGFAAADEIDMHILRFVRERYSRVSAERLISGPGLVQIYIALAELEGRAIVPPHPIPLWQAALDDHDMHACAAVERWLMLLGTFAGDIALAQGAQAVILAGGILPRFAADFDMSPLLSRFLAKGRFEMMMSGMPLALITHPHPGLLGAATVLSDASGETRVASV